MPLEVLERETLTAAVATLPPQAENATTLATLRRETARYHNLDAALADGLATALTILDVAGAVTLQTRFPEAIISLTAATRRP